MQGKQERRIEEVPLLILFYFGRENRGKSRELFNAKNHRTLRWLQNMSSAIEKKYRTSIGFHFIAISYRFNLFCPPVVGWFSKMHNQNLAFRCSHWVIRLMCMKKSLNNLNGIFLPRGSVWVSVTGKCNLICCVLHFQPDIVYTQSSASASAFFSLAIAAPFTLLRISTRRCTERTQTHNPR